MSKESPAIGIDLGTTYCSVAYLNSNQLLEIIENRERQKFTPSYVAFTDDGEIIGKKAKEWSFKKPENVVYDAKRLIGKKFNNKFLQGGEKFNWPFKVTSDAEDTLLIEIINRGETTTYKLQEITAILLQYMKTEAEEKLGIEVKDAVITVPAYFNYHQRTATKEAGELAGLNVLKIINEPTAAALAYAHKNEISGGTKNILVFDLGGGTFDVSIVTVDGKTITVKATAGNTALGGRDFDDNLLKYICNKLEKQYKKNIQTNSAAMRRINRQIETLKINLSCDVNAYLELDNFADDEDVDLEITRSDFDQVNNELFESCINILKDCLSDAKMSKTEIDKVVLVGGSTRIPKIQEMLTNFFEGKQLTKAINPDEAVVYGAAVQAAMFNQELDYKIVDVTPLSLGTDSGEDTMNIIIPRNSQIPLSKTESYCIAMDNQTTTSIAIHEGENSLVKLNTLIETFTVKLPPKPPGYSLNIIFHINTNGILEMSSKSTDGDCASSTSEYEKLSNHTTNDILVSIETGKGDDINSITKHENPDIHTTNNILLSAKTADSDGTSSTIKYETPNNHTSNDILVSTETAKSDDISSITKHENPDIHTTNDILVSAETADSDGTSSTIKYETPNNHTTNNIVKHSKINETQHDKICNVIEKRRELQNYCTKMKALCKYDRRGLTREEKREIHNVCIDIEFWLLYTNEVRDGSLEEEEEEEDNLLDKEEEIESVCEPIANSYGYYVKDMCTSEFHKLITE